MLWLLSVELTIPSPDQTVKPDREFEQVAPECVEVIPIAVSVAHSPLTPQFVLSKPMPSLTVAGGTWLQHAT